MNHPEEFTKTSPNCIIKWVLKERQQAIIRVPSSVSEILAAAKELSLKESMPSNKPSLSSVKPTGDVGTKTIQLQEGDDSKTAIIGAGLVNK